MKIPKGNREEKSNLLGSVDQEEAGAASESE